MRLIDADNIIKTIRSNVRYDDNDTIKKIFDKFISIIQSEPTVNQWISVEDEFPKEKGYYLVTVLAEKSKINKLYVRELKFDGKNFDVYLFEKNLAWQPLPKPYEPKKGSE